MLEGFRKGESYYRDLVAPGEQELSPDQQELDRTFRGLHEEVRKFNEYDVGLADVERVKLSMYELLRHYDYRLSKDDDEMIYEKRGDTFVVMKELVSVFVRLGMLPGDVEQWVEGYGDDDLMRDSGDYFYCSEQVQKVIAQLFPTFYEKSRCKDPSDEDVRSLLISLRKNTEQECVDFNKPKPDFRPLKAVMKGVVEQLSDIDQITVEEIFDQEKVGGVITDVKERLGAALRLLEKRTKDYRKERIHSDILDIDQMVADEDPNEENKKTVLEKELAQATINRYVFEALEVKKKVISVLIEENEEIAELAERNARNAELEASRVEELGLMPSHEDLKFNHSARLWALTQKIVDERRKFVEFIGNPTGVVLRERGLDLFFGMQPALSV